MITVSIKKGYDLNIDGKPSVDIGDLPKPTAVGILPDKIPFIKPRLHVAEGDVVKIGSILFEDKRNPSIKFLSPGAGKVTRIRFGHRRVIQEIVIELEESETAVEFEPVSESLLPTMSRDDLVNRLLEGGVWQYIRELPFRHIADPKNNPSCIFVCLDTKEPFQPQPEVYLKNKKNLFQFGIQILRKLVPQVRITASETSAFALKEFFLNIDESVTHVYKGPYPADDPGVILYYIKQSAEENYSWYINGQDVLLIAQFLKTGQYPIEKTFVLSGSAAPSKKHYRGRIGMPVQSLIQHTDITEDLRIISGGIFRGYRIPHDSFMGFYESSVTMIPEGKYKEFLGFMRPGYHKPSFSRAFLSVFNPSFQAVTSNLHGEQRACVACNHCTYVCPVDMLPQLTFKSILADEIEEAISHGLLDCVECGLCSFVCPSKIEVCSILQDAKIKYYNETRMKRG